MKSEVKVRKLKKRGKSNACDADVSKRSQHANTLANYFRGSELLIGITEAQCQEELDSSDFRHCMH